MPSRLHHSQCSEACWGVLRFEPFSVHLHISQQVLVLVSVHIGSKLAGRQVDRLLAWQGFSLKNKASRMDDTLITGTGVEPAERWESSFGEHVQPSETSNFMPFTCVNRGR